MNALEDECKKKKALFPYFLAKYFSSQISTLLKILNHAESQLKLWLSWDQVSSSLFVFYS